MTLQSLHCGLSGFLLVDHVFVYGVASVSNSGTSPVVSRYLSPELVFCKAQSRRYQVDGLGLFSLLF